MIHYNRIRLGMSYSRVAAIIGQDGVQMGYRTILVLSGGTRREDLVKYAYRPDMVINSVADLCDSPLLRELEPVAT